MFNFYYAANKMIKYSTKFNIYDMFAYTYATRERDFHIDKI